MTLKATILIDHEGRRFRVIPEEDFIRLSGADIPSKVSNETNVKNVELLFSKKLKNAREAKGITQEELADLTGLTQAAISRIEKGRASPRKKNMELLMDAIEKYVPKEP